MGYKFQTGNTNHLKISRTGPEEVYGMRVHPEVDVTVEDYGDNALRIYVCSFIKPYMSIQNVASIHLYFYIFVFKNLFFISSVPVILNLLKSQRRL